MVVYTKNKIMKSPVWNGDITDKINCEWGGVVLLLPL